MKNIKAENLSIGGAFSFTIHTKIGSVKVGNLFFIDCHQKKNLESSPKIHTPWCKIF